MCFFFRITLCFFLGAASVLAASKPHVITFGKWTAVKSSTDLDQNRSDDLKVRAVYVDGRLKEFTFGIPHEVTEQLFVVRRVVRVNDTFASGSNCNSTLELAARRLARHQSHHWTYLAS
jgi:hypothetical protein